jgi:4-hydroxy-3-methylbut-2-enyl diphosphate reductase
MGQVKDGIYLVENVADVAGRSPTRHAAYVTQTTLSVDDAGAIVAALREASRASSAQEGRHLLRHPEPPGRRQVHGPQSDLVLVVGSTNSSNSNRLREVAELLKVPAYLIDNADAIDPAWIVAGGASASPPAPRPRRCWSNPSSPGSRNSAPAPSASSRGVPERVTFHAQELQVTN